MRIHRRYLVALAHVDELRARPARGTVRIGDDELPVSRRHTRELRDRLVRRARPWPRGRPMSRAAPAAGAHRLAAHPARPAARPAEPVSREIGEQTIVGDVYMQLADPGPAAARHRDPAHLRRAARRPAAAALARAAAGRRAGRRVPAALAAARRGGAPGARPAAACSTCGRPSATSRTSPRSSGERQPRTGEAPVNGVGRTARPPSRWSSSRPCSSARSGCGWRGPPATSTSRRASVSPRWNASAIGGEYLSAASFLGVAGLILVYGADMLWFPVGFAAGYLVLLRPRGRAAAPLRAPTRCPTSPRPGWSRGRCASSPACSSCPSAGSTCCRSSSGRGLTLQLVTGAPAWVGGLLVAVVVVFNVATGRHAQHHLRAGLPVLAQAHRAGRAGDLPRLALAGRRRADDGRPAGRSSPTARR